MIAVEYYPIGIGKHIVCIYDRRNTAADIQTLVGESPNPLFCRERITTKTITKNKLVALRFRENEYDLIKSKADKANMNFTEFVTRSALNKQITVVDGLPKILKEVKAISRNLNQLTTICNMGKIICPELSELKEQYSNAVVMLDEIVRRCS